MDDNRQPKRSDIVPLSASISYIFDECVSQTHTAADANTPRSRINFAAPQFDSSPTRQSLSPNMLPMRSSTSDAVPPMYAPSVSDVIPKLPTTSVGSSSLATTPMLRASHQATLSYHDDPRLPSASSASGSPDAVAGGRECVSRDFQVEEAGFPNQPQSDALPSAGFVCGPASSSFSCTRGDGTSATVPLADSSSAGAIFVSAASDCFLAARFFCTRITHYLSWGGDSTRLFILGSSEDSLYAFLRDDAKESSSRKPEWEEALSHVVACVTEYLGSQQVLGLAATPTAIVLGDFENEEALAAAESAMMAAWVDLPGVRTSQQSLAFRYVRFAPAWRSESELGAGASRLQGRSHVDVNLSTGSFRATKSKKGVVCAMIVSYLTQILPLLCHIHELEPRGDAKNTMACLPPVFFTRHGQSEYNIEDRLGGNPALTADGLKDAAAIGKFFENEVADNENLFALRSQLWRREEHDATWKGDFEVWCSQLQRTVCTAAPTASVLTGGVTRKWSYLNEIHAGVCEDMTNSEVRGNFPALHDFRKKNKVAFRYPSGESYLDLMLRLKPVLMELEATKKCIVVVAHQAVLRTLLSYFGGPTVEEAVQAECPHRTVWCCSYDRTGCPRLATITLPALGDCSHGHSEASQREDTAQVAWEGW